MKISKQQVGLITELVTDLFSQYKARLLGRRFRGPMAYFDVTSSDTDHSIEALYRFTGAMTFGNSFEPNEDELKELSEIASNYIDAERLRTLNRILTGLRSAQSQAEVTKVVKDSIEKATTYIETVTVTESRTVQAFAEKTGIQRVAADLGVDDPNVAFLGRYDGKTCKYCRTMYHTADNLSVPKVYKMSQVRAGYFKPKEWDGQTPYFAPLHPHCRHVMTFIPPNFGFDDKGQIKFKDFGYDAHSDQTDTKKNEISLEELDDHGPDCDCYLDILNPNV